jgi:hypothetical protein
MFLAYGAGWGQDSKCAVYQNTTHQMGYTTYTPIYGHTTGKNTSTNGFRIIIRIYPKTRRCQPKILIIRWMDNSSIRWSTGGASHFQRIVTVFPTNRSELWDTQFLDSFMQAINSYKTLFR